MITDPHHPSLPTTRKKRNTTSSYQPVSTTNLLRDQDVKVGLIAVLPGIRIFCAGVDDYFIATRQPLPHHSTGWGAYVPARLWGYPPREYSNGLTLWWFGLNDEDD